MISVRTLLSDRSALADAVCTSRPAANPDIEQFLMQSVSVEHQAQYIGEVFAGHDVLLLGDDDHVSIVLAAFAEVNVTVVELDQRVSDSLQEWCESLGLNNVNVVNADLLTNVSVPTCDAFYINPPFSSKNEGHGIKVWIDRAFDMCIPECQGVIAMPSAFDLDWVNSNWLIVQQFLTDNGARIVATGERNPQAYLATNDIGLRSQNLTVRRVDASLRRNEPRRENPYR